MAGGFTGTVCLKTVEAYDPDTDKWTYMSPMSRVRSGLSMVTNDDQYLYVVGGYDGEHRLSLCTYYIYIYIYIYIIYFIGVYIYSFIL